MNSTTIDEMTLRVIFDHAYDAIFLHDVDGTIIDVNHRMLLLYGVDHQTALQLTIRDDYSSPENPLETLPDIWRRAVAGEPQFFEWRARRPLDGTFFDAEVYLNRIDVNGKILLMATVRDISTRKQAEQDLLRSRALLQGVIESTTDGIVVVDQHGVVMTYNARFVEMWQLAAGWREGEAGYSWLKLLAERVQDEQAFLACMESLRSQPELVRRDLLDLKDGRFFEQDSSPFRVNGQIVGRICNFRDVTERIRSEQQATELQLRKQQTRVLAEFVRDASHDLRTPLSVIGTSLYLHQRAITPEKRQSYLDQIEEQLLYLRHLLDDLSQMVSLDLSANLKLRPAHLNGVLKDLLTTLAERIRTAQLEAHLDLDTSLSTVNLDVGLFSQAVRHLLENAIAFTPAHGQITVRTRQQPQQVLIEIEDSGIGIPPDEQPLIFKRFYKVDKARTIKQDTGTGLGLSMAQHIIEMHGGHIEVESIPETGSVFRIKLPA